MRRILAEIERQGAEPLLAQFEREALRELWRAARTETADEFVARARRVVRECRLAPKRRSALRRSVLEAIGQDIDKEAK